jgi:uncharacterized protein YjbJ (UPF0337 family)
MHESYLKGQWNEVKGKAKERWGDLTDDDLEVIEGKRDQLIGTLQRRYGKGRAEIEREVEVWEERNGWR